MNPSVKRILSTIAIVIASVSFGVLVSADLGLMKASNAQTSTTMQTASGPTSSVTIPSFADVANRVMPAVVSIRSTEIVKGSALRRRQGQGVDPFDFFFPPSPNQQRRPNRDEDEDDEQRQQSGGSGFIISPDGYILTNNHVIEGATKVEVSLGADENGNGGRTVQAKIVGRDPATDLALVKIEGSNFPSLNLGDSDRIRRGDWAIAVGNPFELENTLTVGVISAKGRSLGVSPETQSFENFIQTDAAINFGNSGGPLINIAGEVIGINTAIRGGGAQGLGFATPINTAKRLLPQLREKGKVTRGYLGMSIQDITEEHREAFNLPSSNGALVQDVTEGKPADKAGIQHGDVVVEVDGKAIKNNRDLIDYISYLPVGTEVRITYIRNGERKTVTARTAERPSDGEDEGEEEESATEPVRNRLGMSVQNLTNANRQLYGHPETLHGVLVTSVKVSSAAGDANITEGDVISEVQGQKVENVEQFRAAIDRLKSGQRIRLYVTSGGRGTGRVFSSYRLLQVP